MKLLPTAGILLVCISALCTPVPAQTASVTYDLNDVWLLPDISHPREQARQMTGTFVWTYPVGQFENGAGQFTSLYIPWWGTRTTPTLKITFEPKALSFEMVGSYHDLGLDVKLALTAPLAPDLPSPIDTVNSKFQVEVGVSHQGHVIKGAVVPRCPPPENYGAGSKGSGGHVPTITNTGDARIGNASFRIDCDRLLGGAPCLLVVGTEPARIAVLGFTVLVSPASWIALPVRADGSPGVPGVGTLRVPVPLPDDPKLIGADVYFQALAVDPGSPGGVAAATDGLHAVLCR